MTNTKASLLKGRKVIPGRQERRALGLRGKSPNLVREQILKNTVAVKSLGAGFMVEPASTHLYVVEIAGANCFEKWLGEAPAPAASKGTQVQLSLGRNWYHSALGKPESPEAKNTEAIETASANFNVELHQLEGVDMSELPSPQDDMPVALPDWPNNLRTTPYKL